MTYDPNQFSNDPGAYGGQQSYPPAKNSVAAILGLVFGATSLIPCLGFVTGPAGFISSIIGFFTTGKPQVKGRWMAVLGLLLSIIGFVGVNLLLIGGGGYWAVNRVRGPVDESVKAFVTALANDDLAAAQAEGADFTEEELQALMEQLEPVGDDPTVETTLNGFNVVDSNGYLTGTINGTASGNGTTLNFTANFAGGGDFTDVDVTDLQVR